MRIGRVLVWFSVVAGVSVAALLDAPPAQAAYCDGASHITCYPGDDTSGRTKEQLLGVDREGLREAITPEQKALAEEAIRDASGQAGPPTKPQFFGQSGSWQILKVRPFSCVAARLDVRRQTKIVVEVSPEHLFVVQSDDWNIPPGTYPIGLTYDVDGIRRSIDIKGVVPTLGNGQFVKFSLMSAQDAVTIMSSITLDLIFGSHNLSFPMSGGDVVRQLSICETNKADPFSSMK